MNRTDELIRAAVNDLAAEARTVVGMASAARARGRAIRTRRRFLAAVGTVAAVVLVIGVTVPLRGRAAPPSPPVAVSPTDGPSRTDAPPVVAVRSTFSDTHPVTFAGGWTAAAVGTWVLDPARHVYHRAPGATADPLVVPSPVGDLVAVVGSNPDGTRDRITLRHRDGRVVKTFDFDGDGWYAWSPDGTRLATGISQKGDDTHPDKIGFAVIDVATEIAGRFWFQHGVYDCSWCFPAWTRDGRSIVVDVADRSLGEVDDLVKSVQLFDAADGTPIRSLAITGRPEHPYSWSPDGRYMIGLVSSRNRTYALFDLSTGTSTPFPCDGQWVDATTLLCGTRTGVWTLRPDGTVTAIATATGPFVDPHFGVPDISLLPPS